MSGYIRNRWLKILSLCVALLMGGSLHAVRKSHTLTVKLQNTLVEGSELYKVNGAQNRNDFRNELAFNLIDQRLDVDTAINALNAQGAVHEALRKINGEIINPEHVQFRKDNDDIRIRIVQGETGLRYRARSELKTQQRPYINFHPDRDLHMTLAYIGFLDDTNPQYNQILTRIRVRVQEAINEWAEDEQPNLALLASNIAWPPLGLKRHQFLAMPVVVDYQHNEEHVKESLLSLLNRIARKLAQLQTECNGCLQDADGNRKVFQEYDTVADLEQFTSNPPNTIDPKLHVSLGRLLPPEWVDPSESTNTGTLLEGLTQQEQQNVMQILNSMRQNNRPDNNKFIVRNVTLTAKYDNQVLDPVAHARMITVPVVESLGEFQIPSRSDPIVRRRVPQVSNAGSQQQGQGQQGQSSASSSSPQAPVSASPSSGASSGSRSPQPAVAPEIRQVGNTPINLKNHSTFLDINDREALTSDEFVNLIREKQDAGVPYILARVDTRSKSDIAQNKNSSQVHYFDAHALLKSIQIPALGFTDPLTSKQPITRLDLFMIKNVDSPYFVFYKNFSSYDELISDGRLGYWIRGMMRENENNRPVESLQELLDRDILSSSIAQANLALARLYLAGDNDLPLPKNEEKAREYLVRAANPTGSGDEIKVIEEAQALLNSLDESQAQAASSAPAPVVQESSQVVEVVSVEPVSQPAASSPVDRNIKQVGDQPIDLKNNETFVEIEKENEAYTQEPFANLIQFIDGDETEGKRKVPYIIARVDTRSDNDIKNKKKTNLVHYFDAHALNEAIMRYCWAKTENETRISQARHYEQYYTMRDYKEDEARVCQLDNFEDIMNRRVVTKIDYFVINSINDPRFIYLARYEDLLNNVNNMQNVFAANKNNQVVQSLQELIAKSTPKPVAAAPQLSPEETVAALEKAMQQVRNPKVGAQTNMQLAQKYLDAGDVKAARKYFARVAKQTADKDLADIAQATLLSLNENIKPVKASESSGSSSSSSSSSDYSSSGSITTPMPEQLSPRDPITQCNNLLERGLIDQAIECYEELAGQGQQEATLPSVRASYELGLIYYNGLAGDKDYARAVNYFERLTHQNLEQDLRKMALVYLNKIYTEGGHGVTRNLVTARNYAVPMQVAPAVPSSVSSGSERLNALRKLKVDFEAAHALDLLEIDKAGSKSAFANIIIPEILKKEWALKQYRMQIIFEKGSAKKDLYNQSFEMHQRQFDKDIQAEAAE